MAKTTKTKITAGPIGPASPEEIQAKADDVAGAKAAAAKILADAQAEATKIKDAAEAKVAEDEAVRLKASEDVQKAFDDTVKADDDLAREAAALGVTASKVTISTNVAIKNPQAEADKHARLIRQRTENRIAKAKKAAKTPVQARKAYLKARLANPGLMTQEQVRQCKYELGVIKAGNWEPPFTRSDGKVNCVRAPKKKSAYEKISEM